MSKKVNPYNKKTAKRRRIGRKQWIAIISLLSVVAIVVGIVVAGQLGRASITDSHAGHDHEDELGDGHYEGDGHDHGTTGTTTGTADKVKYQLYTAEDKTRRLVFRDNTGKTIAEFNDIGLLENRGVIPTTIDADKGIVELSWATGSGPNEFRSIFYNKKTGAVSQMFTAPCGSDGVRVAYPTADGKVVVQDIFNKKAYYKEHTLKGAYTKGDYIVISGKLQKEQKAVLINYVVDEKGKTTSTSIKLYV